MTRVTFASLSFCTVAAAVDFPAPEALPGLPALPDVLVSADGTRVADKTEWVTKRAPELRGLFAHYMYGRQGQAVTATANLRHEDRAALGGKARLREFGVDVGWAKAVRLLVLTPAGATKPSPCFLGMNFNGNFCLTGDPKVGLPSWSRKEGAELEKARGSEQEAWGVEACLARGYAVASFHSGDVVPDDPVRAEQALRVFRGEQTRGPADTATIMAWAWGFSRMVDVLQTLPEIDGGKIAVVGHSRNGKTALVAAAYDSRIAMAIPSQAGCGGTAPNRLAPELSAPQANGRPQCETVAVITRNFPHWFAGHFTAFAGTVDKLPFDQHCLIALCAPRPVLLSNATEDQWANPAGQYAMLRAAAPVYGLFGEAPRLPEACPEPGQLVKERLGWFLRPGKHSMNAEDWRAWLDYADQWLK